ncbi:MAG: leucine-rich repeat domain-containing protein, partial [Promethearchaeota archaeon]
TTLPESIGNLSSLKELWLQYNKLTTLPESIGDLKSLKKLNLTDNKLTTLPESIGNLSSLKELLLWNNQLSTLPESIGNLSSLKELLSWNNQLSTLPESISNLKSLNRINLSGNKWKGEWADIETFKDIPKIFELCQKLHGIDIFISHAMIDQADYPIIELKKDLEKGDIIHDVLICEEDLRDSIQAFMDKNVPQSQLLLFIATENSLNSKDCLYELSLAKKYGVKILLIKGNDIDREDLKHIDLREHGKDFMDLSTLEGFEFSTKIFKKLHNYITKPKHESELKLFKKEQVKLDNAKSKMQKNIMDIVDSNEFREHLKEHFEEFQTVSQEVNSNRITDFEYISKLSEILKKKNEY